MDKKEYIEREALKRDLIDNRNFYPAIVKCAIEKAPAADVAAVVHGKWIDNGIPESMLSGCSVCGFPCGAYSFNYCPMCGALMDGGKK